MPSNAPLADIKLHPAFIVISSVALVSMLRNAWQLHFANSVAAFSKLFGAVLSVTGVIVLIFAYGAMAANQTTIDPKKPTTTIVKGGIYRFSRNPIYIGWFLLLLGQGVVRGSVAQLLVAIVMIFLLHYAVVLKEEVYLAAAFGDDYLQYKNKVRRWI